MEVSSSEKYEYKVIIFHGKIALLLHLPVQQPVGAVVHRGYVHDIDAVGAAGGDADKLPAHGFYRPGVLMAL